MGTLCSQLELNQEAGWQVKAKLGTPGGGHDPGRGGGKNISTSSKHGGQHTTAPEPRIGLLLALYPPSPSFPKGEVSACWSMWAALLEREGDLETLGYFWGNMKDFSKSTLNDWFPQET